ncbi:MAG: molybdopterin molybdotransferase MoeA [Planctomycetes bacterium]|nr:molybdopterin molybdotransferase MoeA [Planctomycetota bacterium]
MPRELGHDLVPIEEVRDRILAYLQPLGSEPVPLAQAYGRVLREDAVAAEPIPAFDNSAMDGFAVRSSDIAAAGEASPVTLRVQGGLPAGDPGGAALEPKCAIKIMTGAPVPAGTDAVVAHELTRFDAERVTFTKPSRPGQNIRPAGGDFRPGDVPLRAGAVLGGPQLAILAALGYPRARVTRPARVAIISPGNELVEPGLPCGLGKVRSSNAYSLIGLLRGAGAEPVSFGIVPDTLPDVLGVIERALDQGADAIVSTGGASAGDYDFVQAAVREAARPGHVFKVAMRPGKPQVFGLFQGRPLFGLPGNPASAIISFEVFVRPALRKMRGEAKILEEPFLVRFPFDYAYKPGRPFLLRLRVEPDPAGGYRATRPGAQDSSFLSSLADANAIVFLPAEEDRVAAGELRPAIWMGR